MAKTAIKYTIIEYDMYRYFWLTSVMKTVIPEPEDPSWLLSLPIVFRYHRDTRGGGWSRYGCKSVKTNRTHTVCSCTHLTAFAVLSDLNLQVRLMVVKLLQQKATTTKSNNNNNNNNNNNFTTLFAEDVHLQLRWLPEQLKI